MITPWYLWKKAIKRWSRKGRWRHFSILQNLFGWNSSVSSLTWLEYDFSTKKVSLLQLFGFLLKLFFFFSLPGAMTFRITTFILITLSKWWHYHNSCFSECHFFTEMQSDKMAHFARVSAVIISVVMLTVVAPFKKIFLFMKGSFTHLILVPFLHCS
jgi:hypothetical protein